ncbi:hypothetical protein [Fodinicola feengrottensis]|uniref:hypothetical protein n=1 Tax=Fodinicola feengrottensis TaxID=435914 RepID=UPI0013D7C220|nr:hypothetical protein [Fodinicola feengrottensis]
MRHVDAGVAGADFTWYAYEAVGCPVMATRLPLPSPSAPQPSALLASTGLVARFVESAYALVAMGMAAAVATMATAAPRAAGSRYRRSVTVTFCSFCTAYI